MIPRTKQGAEEALRTSFTQERGEVADSEVATCLTDSLLEAAFAIAWSRQFDDDRGEAKRDFAQLVDDEISRHLVINPE